MKIGVGLPNSIPGTDGRLLVDWARRAEERGFSTLATIDRIAYPSIDSLVALAAAAAVTERIGLLTDILLAPTRNTVLLAKEAASVAAISKGRLTLGLAVGNRPDDYQAAEQPYEDRGRRFEGQLEELQGTWKGEPIGGSPVPVIPRLPDGIPILLGGQSDAAIARVARHGVGWTAGGGSADVVGPTAERVRGVWKEAGRVGEPRIVALTYFSLGEEHTEASQQNLRAYYEYTGMAERIAEALPRTPEAIREVAARFEAAGVDELIFDPSVSSLDQVDRLADVVLKG